MSEHPSIPQVDIWDGVFVVRDDLIPGGTKRRFADDLLRNCGKEEAVYATPACGGAQIALAYAAKETGVQLALFVAKRNELHQNTKRALDQGASVHQVPFGYLNVVQSHVRRYAAENDAYVVPFGLNTPKCVQALVDVAARTRLHVGKVDEVWCAGGSGVLARALGRGFPDARVYVVQVGKALTNEAVGGAIVVSHSQPFQRPARHYPPFPSCANYDAKVWEHVQRRRQAYPDRKLLFWNVLD